MTSGCYTVCAIYWAALAIVGLAVGIIAAHDLAHRRAHIGADLCRMRCKECSRIYSGQRCYAAQTIRAATVEIVIRWTLWLIVAALLLASARLAWR